MVTIIKLCCFVCDIRNSVHDGFSYFPAWYAIPDLTKLLILYVVSNGLTGLFAPNGTLAWGAPEPQVIPPIPDLDSGFSGSTRHYYHATLGTDVSIPHLSPGYQCFFVHQPNRPIFSTNDVVPFSSAGSTEDIRNLVDDERQVPAVMYRTPEKKDSGRRRCQRACAINIEGLWIDKDDLYAGTGQGSDMISVHESQWAKSRNPCGMWIMGSRSHVGAHIRKWHSQSYSDSTVKCSCLWDGCTTSKVMLKDSLNRHVVTVHFGEGFHCQGCDQNFSRKDVYNKHVESGGVCRNAGAAIVYDTERRLIDTRQALQRGNAVRYAGR